MKPFDIEIEPDRRLLRMTMRGYWDGPTFSDFSEKFVRALDTLKAGGGCHYALVDGADFAIQSSEVAQQFGKLIAASADRMASKTASIVPGTLSKLQSEHAGINTARYFTDRVQAEAWLFAES